MSSLGAWSASMITSTRDPSGTRVSRVIIVSSGSSSSSIVTVPVMGAPSSYWLSGSSAGSRVIVMVSSGSMSSSWVVPIVKVISVSSAPNSKVGRSSCSS